MDATGTDADQLRTLAERSREALRGLREGIDTSSDERQSQLGRLGDEATALVTRLSEQVAAELAEEFAKRSSEQEASALAEVESQREAWLAERTEWEAVRDQIEQELASREAALRAEAERVAAERASVGEASAADPELQSRFDEATRHAAEADSQVRELASALEQASEQLAAAAEAERQHAELREKFDIALGDLQTHREHVASLEEQLASRPEENAADAAALAQARQERDDLARELEAALASGPATDAPPEVADLQARFELAVEDVRQLKNENADLRDKLASGAPAASDGNDWEAQKRRLLAELEGEGEPDEEARREERATIAGTIQITDEVIAEKDREIERLRSLGGGEAASAVDTEAQSALLDGDEVIQAERERLAGLEAEWQEKLRAAELELSVERAKIARAQSELAEQQIELETLRAATGERPAEGEARHNWLNKLGLGNEGKS